MQKELYDYVKSGLDKLHTQSEKYMQYTYLGNSDQFGISHWHLRCRLQFAEKPAYEGQQPCGINNQKKDVYAQNYSITLHQGTRELVKIPDEVITDLTIKLDHHMNITGIILKSGSEEKNIYDIELTFPNPVSLQDFFADDSIDIPHNDYQFTQYSTQLGTQNGVKIAYEFAKNLIKYVGERCSNLQEEMNLTSELDSEIDEIFEEQGETSHNIQAESQSDTTKYTLVMITDYDDYKSRPEHNSKIQDKDNQNIMVRDGSVPLTALHPIYFDTPDKTYCLTRNDLDDMAALFLIIPTDDTKTVFSAVRHYMEYNYPDWDYQAVIENNQISSDLVDQITGNRTDAEITTDQAFAIMRESAAEITEAETDESREEEIIPDTDEGEELS